jgi:hypothetical protein
VTRILSTYRREATRQIHYRELRTEALEDVAEEVENTMDEGEGEENAAEMKLSLYEDEERLAREEAQSAASKVQRVRRRQVETKS